MTTIDPTKDKMPVNTARLADVGVLARRLVSEKKEQAQVEARLKLIKNIVNDLEANQLPEAMKAAGVTEFKTLDGSKVTIKKIVQGSIPKEDLEKRAAAFAWLRKNGHEGLIKREISVALAKGEDELGEQVIAALHQLGVEVTAEDSVHPMTLGAWAREMLEEGTPVPFDVLGIYVGDRATVK